MDLITLGRTILVIAAVLFVTGLLMIGLGKLGMGRLPGDISYQHGNVKIYFPIVSSILISVFLCVLLGLIFWFVGRGR